MKIVPNNVNNHTDTYVSKVNKKDAQEQNAAGAQGVKTAGKTDTLTIKGVENDFKVDTQFITNLKNQILTEVKAGADLHKMDDLQKQIAMGEYDINPADIVRKMMAE